MPERQPDERDHPIARAMRERILVLDGSMGAYLQSFGLGESDFRGDRFVEHARDLKGNNDLLCLTRPDLIERIHRAAAAGRRPLWQVRRPRGGEAAGRGRARPRRRTGAARARPQLRRRHARRLVRLVPAQPPRLASSGFSALA